MIFGIDAALTIVAETLKIIKSERDPDKNLKREVLSIKKKLNSNRKRIRKIATEVKLAILEDRDEEVTTLMAERAIMLDELKSIIIELDQLYETAKSKKE